MFVAMESLLALITRTFPRLRNWNFVKILAIKQYSGKNWKIVND